jgi:two-component system, NtrC family, sensor kinase
MKRRSKGRDEAKAQRRKTGAHKSRITPKAVRPRSSSAAREETKVARLTRERDEAFQQQAATAEVLKVISRSTFDLQTVLDTLVESAARLCEADRGVILRPTGKDANYYVTASYRVTPEYIKYTKTLMLAPGRSSVTGRVLLEGKSIQIPDVFADPEFNREASRLGDYRTILGVPLLRKGTPIGVLVLQRAAVRPFTERQIKLVETFADQAVIAIENTRLFEAEQQRTRQLTESLEQQTATSKVLQVISGSPGDLEPVFASMLENAVRICDATFGNIYRWDGEALHLMATHNTPPAFAEYRRRTLWRLNPTTVGRTMASKTGVHIADLTAEPAYTEQRDPGYVAAVELGGIRTLLVVPMLKENELIGVFTVYRQEVRPFTDRQIELVQNFAAQAVIAIENARLLNELRQRTDDLTERTADLTESLQQQTATSNVLKVISRSTFDLPKVLNTLVESAARLCEADRAVILRPTGKDASYYSAASFGHTLEYIEHMKTLTFAPGRGGVAGRVLLEGKSVQIPDVLADPEWAYPETARVGDYRTILGVPLLREAVPIGVFALHRAAVRPFTEKQIKLVETFADQAVIAIENTRLFEAEQQRSRELVESLERQTATSEVLQVISSFPGDPQPVFATMLENAVRICDATFGNIDRWDGEVLHMLAAHNTPPAFAEARRRLPGALGQAVRRMVETKTVTHVADLAASEDYIIERNPRAVAAVELGGVRTYLAVPMVKENELIGSFSLYRQEVRPFTDKQIALVTSFAAQAVIAIENTRLLNDLREALQQQTATADVLKVISRSTFDLQTVLDTLVESAARLCVADRGSILMREGDGYRNRANYGIAREAVQWALANPLQPDRGSVTGRVALEGRPIHIPDVLADPEYYASGYQQAFGFRTILGVPLLREGKTIGVFALQRDEVNPFTDKQIELVSTFADQAVIAIENVRLFEAEQQRTRELTESLEQQTATSEVLRVISSSPGDLEPVFASMLENAIRLCETPSLATFIAGTARFSIPWRRIIRLRPSLKRASIRPWALPIRYRYLARLPQPNR